MPAAYLGWHSAARNVDAATTDSVYVRKNEWFPESPVASADNPPAALPGFAAVIASVNHTADNYSTEQTSDFDTKTRLLTVITDIARRNAIANDVAVEDGKWREALVATVARARKRKNTDTSTKMVYMAGILVEVAGWLLCCKMLDNCMTEKESVADLPTRIAKEWREKKRKGLMSSVCLEVVKHFTDNSNFMQDRFVRVYTALAQDRVGINYRSTRRKPTSNLLFYNWGNPLHLLLSTDDPRIQAFDKIRALRADNNTTQYHHYAIRGASSLAWHEIDSNAQQAYLQIADTARSPLANAEDAAERAVLAEKYSAAVDIMYKNEELAAIRTAMNANPDWTTAVCNKMTPPATLQSFIDESDADTTNRIASFFVVYKNACTDRVSAFSRGLRRRTLFENWGKCPSIDPPLLTPSTKKENAKGVVSKSTTQESPETLTPKKRGLIVLTPSDILLNLLKSKPVSRSSNPLEASPTLSGDDRSLALPVSRSSSPSEASPTLSGDNKTLVSTESTPRTFYHVMANAYMRSLGTHARIEPAAIFSDTTWAPLFVYSDQTAAVLTKLANLWESAVVPCDRTVFSNGTDTRPWFVNIDAQLRAQLDPTLRGKNDVLSCNRT